jgi:hypothetical protein
MSSNKDFIDGWLAKQDRPLNRSERRVRSEYDANPVPEAEAEPQATLPFPKVERHVQPGDIITIPRLRGPYVVEMANLLGGNGGDIPDAWHVIARRLKNGEYDSRGKVARFTQNAPMYETNIKGVVVIGVMSRFVRK